ncbi:MAG: hypothetical protein CL902_00775 [Dehalococcoidia bacterium]|nr:hypothetical protein [Dehalococcoidia bacterium]
MQNILAWWHAEAWHTEAHEPPLERVLKSINEQHLDTCRRLRDANHAVEASRNAQHAIEDEIRKHHRDRLSSLDTEIARLSNERDNLRKDESAAMSAEMHADREAVRETLADAESRTLTVQSQYDEERKKIAELYERYVHTEPQ